MKDLSMFPLVIAAIIEIIWKPLSSDHSDNDRRDRTFSVSATVVAAIAEPFFSQRSQRPHFGFMIMTLACVQPPPPLRKNLRGVDTG